VKTMHFIWPERRRRRRYLTLKNAGLAVIVLIVAFILSSFWSEFRPHSRVSGDLLFEPRVQLHPPDSTPARHDLTIVDEGPIYGQASPDSLLLDQAAQDQLRAAAAGPAATASAAVEQANFEPRTSQLGKGRRITISGGSQGVQLHAEPMPAPAAAPLQPMPPPEPPR
jgi:hypothetical protein